ncbi:CDP-glycerol glycerophosphotransferase family protein [Brevibacterium sp. 91QC2O2]|uniref:CDP-glycerol glycerophosphotransferase family protein n=1 Tax=Brevibacterium sp. 91QC2O2 TaxID=2968458 RepID=UPI00211B9C71|nr:CDP-glycerol glycerophosphotransferase family protein [Brevibacterium sp. 91QC2O2]MCQ9368553.1 CDP-glycerol glycerophosphotransferase family protein [Brevibacterium sp. 91QC2O2]
MSTIAILKARGFAKQGNYKKAFAAISAASIAIDTMSARDSYFSGICLYQLNKFAEAVPYFQHAVDLQPTNISWRRKLATTFERIKRPVEAIEQWDALISIDPLNSDWPYRRGVYLVGRNRIAEAISDLKHADSLNRHNPEIRKALIKALKSQKLDWEIIQYYTDNPPTDTSDHLALMRSLLAMNRYSEAIGHYTEVKNTSALDRSDVIAFASAQIQSGDIHAGISTITDSKLTNPKGSRSPYAAIDILTNANQIISAKHLLQALVIETPSDASAWGRLAKIQDTLQDHATAAHSFKQAASLAPAHVPWHTSLGKSLLNESKYSEALGPLLYGALQKNSPDISYLAGIAALKDEKYDVSVQQFLSAIGRTADQLQTDYILRPDAPPADDAIDQVGVDHAWTYAIEYISGNTIDTGHAPPKWRSDWYDFNAKRFAAVRDYDSEIWFRRLDYLSSKTHDPEQVLKLAAAYLHKGDYRSSAETLAELRIFRTDSPEEIAEYTSTKSKRDIAEYAAMLDSLDIENDVIVWQSNSGDSIGCHPLGLFRELCKRPEFSQFIHVWALNKGDYNMIPDDIWKLPNVIFVPKHSYGYRRALATAHYLVNNATFPGYFIRREGQRYLNTWHGTPYKTLGRDMLGEPLKHGAFVHDMLQATHLMSPNDHTTRVLLDSHDIRGLFTGKLTQAGSPRVDVTINSTPAEVEQLKRRLGLDPNSPVVLYAPTWRGSSNNAEVDIEQISQRIAAITRSGAQVLFRAHRLEERALANANLDVTVVPRDIDTNNLLSIVDVLITDYSSIFYDFLPLDRPIVFFMPDYEEYKAERGLYFSRDNLPGPVAESSDRLTELLCKAISDPTGDSSKRKSAVREFCPNEDGNAASRILEFWLRDEIDDHYLVDASDDREVIVFQQSLIPTGMSASFLNLVNSMDYTRYRPVVLVASNLVLKDEGRLETLSRIGNDVAIIPRIGGRVMTPRESAVTARVEARNRFGSEPELKVYMRGFEREWVRIFGRDTRVSASIQFDGYVPFWNCLMAAAGSSAKTTICYLHNDMLAEHTTRWAHLALTFSLYNKFDWLVSVSETMMQLNRDNIARQFGILASKFVACENVIDPAEIQSRSTCELEDDLREWFEGDTITFVCSGRLSIEKDQKKLIGAFADFIKLEPRARLVLLGDGPLKEDLINLTSDLGISSYVKLAGRRPNPYPYVASADCFVLPSNHEGQPMVLLEALALGRPIIATDIPGSRHVLKDGLGLLVENSQAGILSGLKSYADGGLTPPTFDVKEYQEHALNEFYSLVSGR